MSTCSICKHMRYYGMAVTPKQNNTSCIMLVLLLLLIVNRLRNTVWKASCIVEYNGAKALYIMCVFICRVVL